MTLDHPRLVDRFRSFSNGASVTIALVGTFVLVGWMFNIPTLKSILPIWVTMKANTAIAFLLIGVSLWLQQRKQAQPRTRRMATVCACVVSLIGGLTLSQYLFSWNLGIDQLLFQESATAVATSHPGRMAPNTALNFLMLGLALLLLDVETRRGIRPAQFLTLAAGLVALLASLGYLYGVTALYGFLAYTKMAVHTAVTFLVACLGILSARPDKGLMAVITSDSVGGALALRLLPAAVLIPPILGWLRLEGQRIGQYGTEFGVSLTVIANVIIFVTLLLVTSRSLHRTDAQRTRAEEALRQRTAEVEAANKELEAFSYSVSHDLRAPLRAIDGFSRILLEDHADKLDAEGSRVLNVIRGNTQKMGQLIDDLLAFSRVGRQALQQAEIDMEALARAVFEELRQTTSDRDIQCRVAPLPAARGDRAMLRQVWMNLLSNAIKYTRRRATAIIEVSAHQNDHEVTYAIHDNGVGFDMQYANKLFGVFQRLHRQEEFEGTGVGLASVQRVVHRHGGRVWAEGKIHEGATFYFALPTGR